VKVITRYVFRELIPNYFVGLAFFSVILIINQVFVSVKYIVEGDAPPDKVGKMFLFAFPRIFSLTIPLAVAMASILSFARLSSDSEVVAMRGSGLSLMRTIRPNLFFGLLMFVLSLLFFDTVLPWGNIQYMKTRLQLRMKDPMVEADPREVIPFEGQSIRYDREDRKTKRMYDIHVTQPDGTIIYAQSGDFIGKEVEGGRLIIQFRLYDVYIEQKDTEKKHLLIKTYAPVAVHTFVKNFRVGRFRKQPRTMTLRELLKRVGSRNRIRSGTVRRLQDRQKGVERQYQNAVDALEAYKHKHPKEYLKHEEAGFDKARRTAATRRAAERKRPLAVARRRSSAEIRRRQMAARRPALRHRLAARQRSAPRGGKPGYRRERHSPGVSRSRQRNRIARGRPGVKNLSWHLREVQKFKNRLIRIRRQMRRGSRSRKYSASDIYELNRKIAIPFACFIFTIIGAPLGMFSRRSGKSAGFGFAMGVMVFYWFLLVLGKGWVLSGAMGPVLASWMANIFLGVLGGLLIAKKLRE